MNWDADFAGLPPIELPEGRKLETLACCRAYILALPEREQTRWEGAVAALLKAAQHGGPYHFIARVAFSRTFHGIPGVGPMPSPRLKKQERWKARRKSHDDRQADAERPITIRS